jgi:hypothetical protein
VVAQFMAKNILSRIRKLQVEIGQCVDSMQEGDCNTQRDYQFAGTCTNLPLDYYLVAVVNQLSSLLMYDR